ncbi:MAG: hypothetical protein GY847_28760 [Proteobacteria bacterium]|nr:hypothetical protein [Pseudomonadota bacterium]
MSIAKTFSEEYQEIDMLTVVCEKVAIDTLTTTDSVGAQYTTYTFEDDSSVTLKTEVYIRHNARPVPYSLTQKAVSR